MFVLFADVFGEEGEATTEWGYDMGQISSRRDRLDERPWLFMTARASLAFFCLKITAKSEEKENSIQRVQVGPTDRRNDFYLAKTDLNSNTAQRWGAMRWAAGLSCLNRKFGSTSRLR